ncbi:MAG: hypothetical protein GJ680_18655 [Alteromonadaceae bacterium]|nr:hypothetical protein [Alteromonadaceae bacterium]
MTLTDEQKVELESTIGSKASDPCHRRNIDPFDWAVIISLIDFNPDKELELCFSIPPYHRGGATLDLTPSPEFDAKLYGFSGWLDHPANPNSFLCVEVELSKDSGFEFNDAGDLSYFPLSCEYVFTIDAHSDEFDSETEYERWGSHADIKAYGLNVLSRHFLDGDQDYALDKIVELQIEECLYYTQLLLNAYELPLTCQAGLTDLFKDALWNLSPSKLFYFINKAVKDANEFYKKKGVPKPHAVNSMINRISGLLLRAQNENWSFNDWSRDKAGRGQSILASIIFEHYLCLPADNIYYSLNDIKEASDKRHKQDRLICQTCFSSNFKLAFVVDGVRDTEVLETLSVECIKCGNIMFDIRAVELFGEDSAKKQIGRASNVEFVEASGRPPLKFTAKD